MVTLFDKFRVFKDRSNQWVVANQNEMVMTDRYTGEEKKCNINDFCNLIKTIFPDREEQKELLQQIFNN